MSRPRARTPDIASPTVQSALQTLVKDLGALHQGSAVVVVKNGDGAAVQGYIRGVPDLANAALAVLMYASEVGAAAVRTCPCAACEAALNAINEALAILSTGGRTAAAAPPSSRVH